MNRSEFQILVCRGAECAGRRHADAVWAMFGTRLAERGLADRVRLDRQNCFGRCRRGPNVLVRELVPADRAHLPRATALYNEVSEKDVAEIVAMHLGSGQVVERLIEPALRSRLEGAQGASAAPNPVANPAVKMPDPMAGTQPALLPERGETC